MKRIRMLFYIMLFTICFVQAQDTTHISLVKILQQIEANYPSVLQFQYDIQSLQAKVERAKSWMPPTFSTGVMPFPYNFKMLNEKDNPMNQAGIAFSLEQMIPNSSKLNAKKDYISSLSEIEKSKSDWTKDELRREAKILYYGRYAAEKQQQILKESEEMLKLLLATVEEKFSNNQSQLQTISTCKKLSPFPAMLKIKFEV